MCWITNKTKHTVPHFAKKNIMVKKVLTLNKFSKFLTSPVYSTFNWYVGEVRTENIRYVDRSDIKLGIDGGFHSAARIERKVCKTYGIDTKFVSSTKNGGHEVMMFSCDNNDFICDFVIPKGSTYYMNEYGEYVSDRIVFLGVNDPENNYGRSLVKKATLPYSLFDDTINYWLKWYKKKMKVNII